MPIKGQKNAHKGGFIRAYIHQTQNLEAPNDLFSICFPLFLLAAFPFGLPCVFFS